MSESNKQVLAVIGICVFGIAEALLVITLIALVCR